jgi:hypothetical protein
MIRFPRLRRRKDGEPVEYGELRDHDEFMKLIDAESRRLLGIPGDEFLRLRDQHQLPERPGVRTLSMLASLEPQR